MSYQSGLGACLPYYYKYVLKKYLRLHKPAIVWQIKNKNIYVNLHENLHE